MKKTFSSIRILAALLIASAALGACTSDENDIIGEQPAQQQASQVYNLTLSAGKAGGDQTRALELSGTKIVAKWVDGDKVKVANGGTDLGELTATDVSADGQDCTLTGALTGTVSAGDVLTLTYHPASISSFVGQDGTVASASDYDMAVATVTVKAVDAGNNITITESSASFATQTAMLKITMQEADGTTAIDATTLEVKYSVGGVEAPLLAFAPASSSYTANGSGVLYFAMPSAAMAAVAMGITETELAALPIKFVVTYSGGSYTVEKTGYPFAAGKYYATTLTNPYNKKVKFGGEQTVPAGQHWFVEGTDGTGCLGIEDGATVTLAGVTMEASDFYLPAIKCMGNATIILADGTVNSITNSSYKGGGIQAGPSGTTLTIKGNTGKLTVTLTADYISAAAIGSFSSGVSCGNIVIEGGIIEATAINGAGIGACSDSPCGDITIKGGTVTATGAESGAGIGGYYYTACGNITISGGTVTATGAESGAGIGSGSDASCGDITITSGVTKVTAATNGGYAQSIGAGKEGTCGTVTIGGVVVSDGIDESPYTYQP